MADFYNGLSVPLRILAIILLGIAGHYIVKGIRKFIPWLLSYQVKHPEGGGEFSKKFPKTSSLLTIFVSALSFTIYFIGIGLILSELKISLTTYLASATVIGLAIGFGLQGFVQDVVIGLTLIFSDALNIGEMVEMSGQIGKVNTIGLRFTTLINITGQKIYIPNRNIIIISRYRKGVVRAYADIQIPENSDEEEIRRITGSVAKGMFNQHRSIILSAPEDFGVKKAEGGNWSYIRIKFRIWPGQNALIETIFKQRVVFELKKIDSAYADWMVSVTYKSE